MTVHKFESSRKTTVEINEYKHIKRKNMKNNPQKKILRQDGFPIGAEMAKKRYSSAGTTTPFLKQLILTILLFAILPVTALAAGEDAPGTLYVGQTQITGSGYWKTNSDGTLTTEGANNDNYNVYYDGNGTLTLNSATIKGDNSPIGVPFGAGIYAQCSSNQPVALTIELIGTNTITGHFGIYVDAQQGETVGTNASLLIQNSGGDGSLGVSGFNHGIYVKSGTGDASLTINDASVVAKTTQTYSGYAGVCVQSSIFATSSPQLSLAVNGGSLTASGTEGNDGIQFYVGDPSATNATTSLTVSNNAIVRAENGIKAERVDKPTPSGTGIVFDGTEGTVYGDVTLQEDLEIGEGESLTIPDGASLNTGSHEVIVNGGTLTGGDKITGTVKYAPAITTESLPNGTVNEEYSQTLAADGDATITWSSSDLPEWLTLDSATGVISGTPTTSGTSTFTVKAESSYGSDSKELSITISAPASVSVTGVSLNKDSLNLYVGGNETLTATVEPANATNKGVTWSSSAPGIATVDANGKVTAVAPGTATITVTTADGSKTATCAVTVNPMQYTVTVQTDGNGSASAAPATAPAGTTVTLTADPDSGYHFERWEIVSGTVTISSNQFTMPAEHVTVKAVFDRNSSGGSSSSGGSGSSYRDREYDFWMEVKEKLRDAEPGDIVKANARTYDRMPWSVMEALREAEGVTLHITWNGGEDIIIPSEAALREQSRVYYPLSYLADMTFEVESEAPAYDPGKVNPETGGILEVTAPAAADSLTDPVTDPQRGLAETPELAEKGIEQPLPGIYEPEEAVAATPTEETGTSGLLIAGIALALAAAAGGGLWYWKRRTIR